MSVNLDTWVPKFIQTTSTYQSGATPTAAEINSFFNLLIAQGNDTAEVLAYIVEIGATEAFTNSIQPLIDAIQTKLDSGEFIGEQGPLGPTGATGPQGIQGTIGVEGPVGPAGPTGPQGVKGDTGPAGADGSDGADGVLAVANNEFGFYVKDGNLFLVTDDTATVITTAHIAATGHLIVSRTFPEEG